MTGRREYPAWAELTQEEIDWLNNTVTYIDVHGVKFPVCNAMVILLKNRPDVIKNYTINGKLDQIATLAWFYVLGVKEHLLECVLTPETIKKLDSPIKLLPDSGQEGETSELPTPTVLMMLVWQLLDAKNQKLFDIKNSKSRKVFFSWFFVIGVRHFKIERLVPARWRIWLQMKIKEKETGQLVTHSKILERQISPTKSLSDGPQQIALWQWLKKLNDEARTDKPKKQLTKEFGVNLYGFAYGELGIGEDLRMAVACCAYANIPYRIINIEVGANVGSGDRSLERVISLQKAETDFPLNIFIIPGFDTAERLFLKLGKKLFENHYNIGWWPWELSVWPKRWNMVFELVEELWGGSPFTYETYKKYSNKKTILMPLAVTVDHKAEGLKREYFNLPANWFLFMYIFDFNSHVARKNPQAAVEAFKIAFPVGNKEVGLVLKVMNSDPTNIMWNDFLNSCSKDQRIFILDRTMNRPEILALMGLCDCYISTHRAEGFGRTIAENLLLGKPTIATNYSGNQHLMSCHKSYPVNYKLRNVKKGEYHFIDVDDQAVWAEIDRGHLAKLMNNIYNKNKIYKKNNYKINDIVSIELISSKLNFRLKEIFNEI